MFSRWRLVWRWFLYITAAGVILLAMLVGLLRLLLPLAPEYQDEIRRQASEATGYQLEFRSISASWPLSGPELSFYDARLTAPGEQTPLFAARELSAGVSLLGLLRDRRFSLASIGVEGATVELARDAAGRFLVQGRAAGELLPKRRPEERVRPLTVRLQDVRATYTDRRRGRDAFPFQVDRLAAHIGESEIRLEGGLALETRYGRRLEFALEFPLSPGAAPGLPPVWHTKVTGTDLNLAEMVHYWVENAPAFPAGRGNLRVEADFAEHTRRIAVGADLRELQVGSGTGMAAYDALAGNFVWSATPQGWDLAASDVRLRRDGRDWPASTMELRYRRSGEATPAQWVARASFLRLEDLLPFLQTLSRGTEWGQSLPRRIRGELREVAGEFSAEAEAPTRFSLRADFRQFGVTSAGGEFAADGLSGSVVADGDGGRLQLDSERPSLELQEWFRQALAADHLTGLLVWRSGASGISLLSDDIRVAAPGISIQSRLKLDFPADRSSPLIDLKASASAAEARQALRYLPLQRFPAKVVGWLERAVVSGRIPEATVEFRGPVRAFPFAQDEGVFRANLALEDGVLDYANDWPRVERMNGTVVFDGVSMYSTHNSARVGNLAVADYTVRIPDLRRGVLAISGRQRVGLDHILAFLRGTPVARALGPTLARVNGTGPVDAALRLALPLKEPEEYDLKVVFDAGGCSVGMTGLDFGFEKLQGRARLENTRLSAERLTATLFQTPVEISVSPVADSVSAFSHVARVTGSTPVPKVTSAFRLPLAEYFSGQLDWSALARIPARRAEGSEPLRISIRSAMVGVTSALPAPLAKPGSATWPLALELAFPSDGVIELAGATTEPAYGWAVRLRSGPAGWQVERGSVAAGAADAALPTRPGVELSGRVAAVHLGDWLELGGDGAGRAFREIYREARLTIDRLHVAGQIFRDVQVTAHRDPDGWALEVSAPNAAGRIAVPFDTRSGEPLVLAMERLWLLEPDSGATGRPDPRDVPAVQLKAADAALGEWRFGAVELSASKAPDGLVVRHFSSRARSFSIEGDGAWRVEGMTRDRQYSRLQASLTSTDFRDTLAQLGYDPAIEAKSARTSVNIVWPDAPSADFLRHASGQISVAISEGQIVELEPGGGRLLGLLSVTALPRRLALDFRDVFNEGLAFDTVRGDFRVVDGAAYTCNLGLEGPVADLAIVGRAGLAAKDYEQLAVVRPQVSSVLTVGGAVLGGPVGGATMLLISQLFRKPLSTLGESYYRVSGSWDQPVVERIQRSEADTTAFKECERELAATLQAIEEMPGAGTPAARLPTPSP